MKTDLVRIFEVGPRDGLQNEPKVLTLKEKIDLVEGLVAAGFRDIELGAFVRADRVPQMQDSDLLYAAIQNGRLKLPKVQAWCLVPNRKGLQRALRVGAKNIAVFTAASETFARKNIGMSIEESLLEFKRTIQMGRNILGDGLRVRGYISTAFGCPFEGKIRPLKILRIIEKLLEMGIPQISVGDTIGVATPKGVDDVIRSAVNQWGSAAIAVHFHDTRGTALANSLRSLDIGVRTVDSSAGGLGGCPFAPGAAGNLATEDLVYMLNGMGMNTGINLDRLCQLSIVLAKKMKRPISSKYVNAYISQRSKVGGKSQACVLY